MTETTQPTGNEKTVQQTHPIKRFFKRVLYFFIFLFIIIPVGTYFYLNSAAEEGYSSGMLINFSKKGLLFKTYEGVLNSGSINSNAGNSMANNTWTFSVKDDGIAQQLNDIMKSSNKNVSLHYVEKRGNFFWQGETNRFVDEVKVMK